MLSVCTGAMVRILRGLASRTLPCGCILGLYECYDGRVVTIVDHHDPACSSPAHRRGAVLAAADSATTPNGSAAAA